jgi:hypothetical protein
MMPPSSVSLILFFLVKLFLIKVFINEVGVTGARDIFIFSSIAQLAFLLQLGKLAKSKNMFLLGEIGNETLNCVYFTINVIFLSTVSTLVLIIIVLVDALYIDVQIDFVLLGVAYGYFVLQTQIYLLRAEAVGNKQYSYLVILSLNTLILAAFSIPAETLTIKITTLIIVNAVLFLYTRSRIDMVKFNSINGWCFYKIESISTTVSLIELPLIAYAVAAEDVIIYLLFSRILYAPVLFYGQVSRFLWSDGIKYLMGMSYMARPKMVNVLYAGVAVVGVMVLAFGFDIVVKFFDEGIAEPSQILIALFSAWALVQIANRYFKNHYLGNSEFENQYKGFVIIGALYLVGLVTMTVLFDNIAFFVGAKLIYSFLVFLYNLSFIGKKTHGAL